MSDTDPFRRVHIIQGEYRVVDDPDVVLSTILGSCVAVCLRDPIAAIGGMNHFLLPGSADILAEGGDATRYGVHLMELLINGLLKKGARRDRLEAKVFGGAKSRSSFSNVGERNATFAMQFLKNETIPVAGFSTGGEHGRKLEYWPVSGRARQYPLTGAESHKNAQVEAPSARLPLKSHESAIEFF